MGRPKGKAKAKGKAKGKAKAGGKAVAKTKAKAKPKAKPKAKGATRRSTAKALRDITPEEAEEAAAEAAKALEEAAWAAEVPPGFRKALPMPEDAAAWPIPPKARAKAKRGGARPKARVSDVSFVRRKVVAELGDRSVEDAMEEQRTIFLHSEVIITEVTALQAMQDSQVVERQTEFERARINVEEAMEREQAASELYCEVKERNQEVANRAEDARQSLLESQQKSRMLDVMAANQRRLRELEEMRRKASATAEAARQDLMLQRQKQKEALEVTRKALEEAKLAAKGMKRSSTSPSSASAKRAGGLEDARWQSVPCAAPRVPCAAPRKEDA